MRISDWSSDVCSSDLAGATKSFPLLCREWCPDHISTIHPASADRMRAFEPLQSAGKAATGQPRPTLRIRDVDAITVGIVLVAGLFRPSPLGRDPAGIREMMLLPWSAASVPPDLGRPTYA